VSGAGAACRPVPPIVIHVDQHGDQLRLAVGVDAAVLALGAAAHRHHGRPSAQIDGEFVLAGLPHRRPFELGEEGAEARSETQLAGRKAARFLDARKIRRDGLERCAVEEAGHDEMGIGIGRQRRRCEAGGDREGWLLSAVTNHRLRLGFDSIASFETRSANAPQDEEGLSMPSTTYLILRRRSQNASRRTHDSHAMTSRPQSHPLQPDDAVGEGGEAVELGGRAP